MSEREREHERNMSESEREHERDMRERGETEI